MPIRILVVDDERNIVDSLSEILEGAGYQVARAYSADEALASTAVSCPNVLLSDVLMPGMTGFDLALRVKQACPSCRLLLFSGQAATAELASKYIQKFTSQGYRFELLPKPTHPTVLLKRLEDAMTHVA
jgi:CheY-like chemotaxis protein